MALDYNANVFFQFVNYYNFKEDNPEFFNNVQFETLREIGNVGMISTQPFREGGGRRILIYRMGKKNLLLLLSICTWG